MQPAGQPFAFPSLPLGYGMLPSGPHPTHFLPGQPMEKGAMSEKSPSYIEALQGIDPASGSQHSLSYDTQKTGVAFDQEIPNEQTSHRKLQTDLSEAPDGGIRAWLAVFAQYCIGYILYVWFFNFMGCLPRVLPGKSSASHSTFNYSMDRFYAGYALVCLPSLATGRLFDLGYFKIPFFVASCVLVACTFLTAECTQFWQLFLTQGVGLGMGCGFVFSPAIVIVSHWFSKRRGLALSITAVGSALGSIVFPVAAQNLIPLIGFRWTFLKRRLPPVNVRGGLFNLKAFRDKAYSTYCISATIILLGFYTELTYISVSAVAIGVSKDFSFYIIAIANAASAFGRVSSGLLADKIGALNTIIVFTAITGITTIAWPFAKDEYQLIAIATIHGFSIGAYISLYSVPAVAMGEMEDAGASSGDEGSSMRVIIQAGGSIIFGVALLLVARHLHLGRLWGKF
ncbi:MFS general substrate transporter [Suillus subalutaceus]|uniref:MFS general substrate transporter n=1 Tax=Suillus subalutaceus TaxID=48586 RepID=UPI001B86211A|nr:MFS general substrate transporter [Suillus subalutaceus]KAG1863613.1 MFS general substrate transporter [Suillus subalutaceus]